MKILNVFSALQIVGKRLENATIVFVGTGAANIAVSRLLFFVGIKPQNCIAVDDKGILHLERNDIGEKQIEYPDKWKLCQTTNPEQRKGSIQAALCGADVCIALSKSGPGVILPQWISKMNKDAIVFACANPNPEIWPEEAKISGARIVATGRSDFPNQVNNSLVFPALFRGTLDVRAKTITNEMCIAAAESLANFAQKRGIDENNILPTMGEKEAFIAEAAAVGMKAQEQGVARIARSVEDLRRNARTMINKSQRAVRRK